MHVENDNYNILGTKGDHHMGGLKFDEAIRDLLIEKLLAQGYPQAAVTEAKKMQLLIEAEKLKIQLSVDDEAFYEDEDGDFGVIITRDEFILKTQNLVMSTEVILRDAVEHSGLDWSNIDHVLLVGGSTRLPIIRQRVQEITGQVPRFDLNPDTIVAEGASIIADLLVNNEVSFGELEDGVDTNRPYVMIHDVTSQGIGILYKKQPNVDYGFGGDYYNGVLLKRNTQIPTQVEKRLYAVQDGQNAFKIRMTEGNMPNPIFIEKFILDGIVNLPNVRRKGEPLADISVYFDAEQIIHVTVKDSLSGQVIKSYTVQGSASRVEEEMEEDLTELQAIFDKFVR
jgi:molecular chaperone DnaK